MRTALVARRRTGEAAGAGLLLTLLLAGPPVALSALVGNALPRRWPSMHGLENALAAPLSDTAVLHVFAVVTWLAWAHLLACVVAEILRQLRGASVRVPLGGVNAWVAQRLVAALLVAVSTGGGATALTPALAASTTPLSALRLPTPAPAVDGDLVVASLSRSVVAGPVTNIAPDAPATPRRYQEYVVAPPDGRHHDNLWDIADRHLGDPLRWKDIFALNDGRAMPDGQRLTRASLIRPGWVLRMPPDAVGLPTTRAVPTPHVDPSAPPQPSSPPRKVQPHHAAAAPTGAPGHGQWAPQREAAPVPRQPEVTRAETPASRPAPAAHSPAAPVPLHAHRDNPALPVGAGLGVAALALVAALDRRRRAAARRRPTGSVLALPAPELREAEASLRRDARQARAVADTVRLAVALAGHRDPVPTVVGVVHHVDGAVELRLDGDYPPPPPFEATTTGWVLRPEQHGYLFSVTGRDDPVPVLLPVGLRGNGAACYVNVEHTGAVTVDGETALDIDAVLAGFVRAMAGAPWAEQTQMVVPNRLSAAAVGLERVDVLADPPRLLDHLTRYAERVATALPADTTVAGARRDGAADAVGVVVLVGFTAEELSTQLLDAARLPTHPVVAILAGAATDTVTWRIDDDGLHVPELDVTVTPPRADVTDLETTNRLLEQATEAPVAAADDAELTALRADCPPDAAEPDEAAVQVNMLGPLEVNTPVKTKRATVRGIALYLALHRRPVQDSVLYARLFPDSEFNRDIMKSRMWEARRLLAGALEHVGQAWQVTDAVKTDWQRFQALAAGTFAQQRAALRLVRGRPFDGYDAEWLQVEGHDRVIEAVIVDLALSVAERALAAGDDRAATEAAEAGLRACPYDERLYRVGMRASAARGATGEVRAYMTSLKTVLDIDVEPDDHIRPETEELYRELVGNERRAG
jgi:DNA-binding SARP family transcriptional activator